MRDLILIRWSTKLDEDSAKLVSTEKGLTYASQLRVVSRYSFQQYWTLLKTQRRRNAAMSAYTVMLAQQLCGSKFDILEHPAQEQEMTDFF